VLRTLYEILCDIWNGLVTTLEELALFPLFMYWMAYFLSLVDPR
jgi:hypothetical protein